MRWGILDDDGGYFYCITYNLLGGKAMSKIAAAVNKVMCEAFSGQPHLSVTPDRGKEFSKHAPLKKELKRVLKGVALSLTIRHQKSSVA